MLIICRIRMKALDFATLSVNKRMDQLISRTHSSPWLHLSARQSPHMFILYKTIKAASMATRASSYTHVRRLKCGGN